MREGGHVPVYGPTKTKKPRTIKLADSTMALLRAHKAHQGEVKLRNRTVYHDNGLIFAREGRQPGDVRTRQHAIGDPIEVNNIGQRALPGSSRPRASGRSISRPAAHGRDAHALGRHAGARRAETARPQQDRDDARDLRDVLPTDEDAAVEGLAQALGKS